MQFTLADFVVGKSDFCSKDNQKIYVTAKFQIKEMMGLREIGIFNVYGFIDILSFQKSGIEPSYPFEQSRTTVLQTTFL